MSKHKSIQKSQATKIPKLDIPNGFSDKEMRYMKELRPKTDEQQMVLDAIKDSKICLINSVTATGKTFLMVGYGILELLKGNYEKILLCRPCVTSWEDLGALPGNLSDKVFHYMIPMMDELKKYVDEKDIENLIERKKIEITSIGYLRGRSLHKTYCCCDEFQNLTLEQFKLLISRVGRIGKVICAGDSSQRDIPKHQYWDMDLVCGKLSEINGVSYVKMTEKSIIRENIIVDLVKKFEELSYVMSMK